MNSYPFPKVEVDKDDPFIKYELIKLHYKYQFYQVIMVSCSTLLGVLVALLPQKSLPTEGRTLYLYCCAALALCVLLSGTVLFVLLSYPDLFRRVSQSQIWSQGWKEDMRDLQTYDTLVFLLSFVLYYLIAVAVGLLFFFLSLMLSFTSDQIVRIIPQLPRYILDGLFCVAATCMALFLYKWWSMTKSS